MIGTVFTVGGLVIGLVSALIGVRNSLVGRVRTRRLAEIHDLGDRQIAAGVYEMGRDLAAADDYGKRSYDAMMFDLRKWTYRQFYPRSVEECLTTSSDNPGAIR